METRILPYNTTVSAVILQGMKSINAKVVSEYGETQFFLADENGYYVIDEHENNILTDTVQQASGITAIIL